MCRKPKHPFKPNPRVNNVDDSISETATVGTSATVEDQVNHIDRLLKNIVSTMPITIRTMTIMMTTVLQQSPSKTTLEKWSQ